MSEQERVNVEIWRRGDFVAEYARRNLSPPEVIVLARYREAFGGRVLDLGCGAGRIAGYLIELGADVLGTDIAEPMIEYCRRTYPDATFRVQDLREAGSYADESFDAVLATNNLLDILDDAARRGILADLARILRPGGLLVMSSHNRAYAPRIPEPRELARRAGLPGLAHLPAWSRNRRRMRRLQRDEPGYAILNDEAHDYRLLHYYIGRDEQERQLGGAGLRLLECLDGDGRRVAPGESAEPYSELYYVARRPGSGDEP